MHLQHPRAIETVRVFRPSPTRKYGLIALCAVAYAVSFAACYHTAGVPRAADDAKAIRVVPIDQLQQQLKDQSARIDEVAADTNEPPPPHY